MLRDNELRITKFGSSWLIGLCLGVILSGECSCSDQGGSEYAPQRERPEVRGTTYAVGDKIQIASGDTIEILAIDNEGIRIFRQREGLIPPEVGLVRSLGNKKYMEILRIDFEVPEIEVRIYSRDSMHPLDW